MRRALILAWLLIASGPVAANAQVFFASTPKPTFKVGPVYVRALVTPALGDVAVNVFFGLDFPPGTETGELEQDLYFVWPSDVAGDPSAGPADPSLANRVEELGFTALESGRLVLTARNLYKRGADGRSTKETIPGGAPFVTFIRSSGGPTGFGPPRPPCRAPP